MKKTIQKVITIGTSLGVTLPAEDLREMNTTAGDKVELWFTKVNDGLDKNTTDKETDD